MVLQIKEQMEARSGRRTMMLSVLAAVYLPLSFTTVRVYDHDIFTSNDQNSGHFRYEPERDQW